MLILRKTLRTTCILGLGLAVLPVAIGAYMLPTSSSAHADNGGGKGGGNSGGNGGHNGGGNAGGGGAAGHANSGDKGGANPSGHGGDSSADAGKASASSQAEGGRGVGKSPASGRQLARASGALNAAHASSNALAHAAPKSRVGQIATYDRSMLTALAMPTNTAAQLAARDAVIAASRAQLATVTNKNLTPSVVTLVDARLGLPEIDPTLGVYR